MIPFNWFTRGFLLFPAETEVSLGTTETQETKTEETQEETREEETAESQGEETTDNEELDEEGTNQAKILYKALMGPERDSIIAALAAKAGILKAPVEETSAAQERKEKKAIQEIIKEALPDYPALAKQLGSAIEQVLEQEREAQQETLQTLELNDLNREVNGVLTKLRAETKGESQKLEKVMAQLSEEILKAPNVSIESYVRNLYKIASSGESARKVQGQIANKIRQNASNTSERLKSKSGGSQGTLGVPIPAKKGLHAAVQAALESLESKK